MAYKYSSDDLKGRKDLASIITAILDCRMCLILRDEYYDGYFIHLSNATDTILQLIMYDDDVRDVSSPYNFHLKSKLNAISIVIINIQNYKNRGIFPLTNFISL